MPTARNPLAEAFVVSRVALSLVLMVGAGLFLRTLANLNDIDPGFNRENVLRLSIDSGFMGLKGDDPRLNEMFRQIESRVSSLPGVKAASFSAFTFAKGSWTDAMIVPGMPGNENSPASLRPKHRRQFSSVSPMPVGCYSATSFILLARADRSRGEIA